MRHLTALAIACAVACTAPAATPTPSPASFDALAKAFDYDAGAPLDAAESRTDVVSGIQLSTVTFASPKGGRATALLATPTSPGPDPAVLMIAGSNQPPSAFRDQAVAIAREGAIALVLDQSQTRPGHTPLYTFTVADRDEFVQTTIDARRSIDVLLSIRDVDRTQLAFWGFSHGAFIGGLLSGVERRITSFVLQSGGGTDYLRTEAPRHITDATALRSYLDLVDRVDPDRFVAHAAPAALFLQNGEQDATYTREGVAAWQAAASEPKRLATYPTGHLLSPSANADAIAWLGTRMAIAAPATIAGARGSLSQARVARTPTGPLFVSLVKTELSATGSFMERREAGFELVVDGAERITVGTRPSFAISGGQAQPVPAGELTQFGPIGTATSYFMSLRPSEERGRSLRDGQSLLYASADLPASATPPGGYTDELVLLVLTPGAVVPPHMHGGVEPMYVIEGTIDLRVVGQPIRRLGPGGGATVLPDTPLLVTNVGSVIARVLVMLATPDGKAVQTQATMPP